MKSRIAKTGKTTRETRRGMGGLAAATTAGQPGDTEDQWWPVETPFGRMVLAGNDEALHHLRLPGDTGGPAFMADAARRGRPVSVAEAEIQLAAYFAGGLTRFDLPLAPQGTEWQRKVWQALVEIPYGETRSYGFVAAQVGNPRASRAVGLANNRNPIALIIPCHRVIGADGSLTGYGGGLPLKGRLLAHERRVLDLVSRPVAGG